MEADIRLENYGSVTMLRPLTEDGRDWMRENVQAESWQWFGGALAAEPRMCVAVVDGAEADGLMIMFETAAQGRLFDVST